MSIEGGQFHCYLHDYKTDSVKSWNTHMMKEKHTDIVDTKCVSCGADIHREIPYQPIQADGSKGISLKCNNCEKKEKSK